MHRGIRASVITLALIAAGCGASDEPASTTSVGSVVTTTAPTATTTEPPTTTTEPPTTAAPRLVDVKVYLVRGQRLAIAHRRVAAPAILRGALDALFDGLTATDRAEGLTTAVPAGTRLRDVALADGTATVDLTGSFGSGGGSLSMSVRLAQVLYTATQFANVERVVLRLDGIPVGVLGGEGLTIEGPLTRASVPNQISGGILVDQPRPGSTVRSPFVVTGEGDVYEGEFAIAVYRGSTQVAFLFGIRTGAWGTWAPFSATISLDIGPGPIRLVIDTPNPCGDDPECPPKIVTELLLPLAG